MPGEWSPGPQAPTARQQLGVAAADGAIWVLGGITEAKSTAVVERFDPKSGKWSKGPDLPLPLHHEMAVAYRGRAVALGGWLPVGGSLNAATSDRVFELRGNTWKELARLPRPRAAGAAAVIDDKLFVFGGQASGRLVSETDVFDGKSWTSVAPLGTPRDHLAGVSDGKFVYAIGGRDLSPDKNFDTVERYDAATNTWQQVAPLPTARGDISAAAIAGKIIVVGGETSTTVFNTVEALDTNSLTWAPAPAMATPRHGLGVIAAGASVYAIGGALEPGHSASAATVETLEFTSSPVTSSQWQPARAAPTPRQQAATAVDGGTVWVMGGLTTQGGVIAATTTVEGYDQTIDTWKKGPDLPLPLHDAMATTFKGELVVLGGWVSEGNRLRARLSDRAYALRQGDWVELPPLKTARAGARPRSSASACSSSAVRVERASSRPPRSSTAGTGPSGSTSRPPARWRRPPTVTTSSWSAAAATPSTATWRPRSATTPTPASGSRCRTCRQHAARSARRWSTAVSMPSAARRRHRCSTPSRSSICAVARGPPGRR